MLRIEDSHKKLIFICQYKILNVLFSNENKDTFQVEDLKNNLRPPTLKILKSNQNPKQIDNKIS